MLHGDRIEKSTFNRHCERPWGAWQSRNEAFRPHKWSLRVYIGLDCRGLKGLAMTFVGASYVLDVALNSHATRLRSLAIQLCASARINDAFESFHGLLRRQKLIAGDACETFLHQTQVILGW